MQYTERCNVVYKRYNAVYKRRNVVYKRCSVAYKTVKCATDWEQNQARRLGLCCAIGQMVSPGVGPAETASMPRRHHHYIQQS